VPRVQGWLLDLLGSLTPYPSAWSLQRGLVGARQAGAVPDTLVLVEHPPVVTIGRSGRRTNLLAAPALLAARGIEVFDVERGGDITYHGPGQLVGYPIVDLRTIGEDIVRFMRMMEQSVIGTLETFGITAVRERGFPGVWVNGAKVAAVGVAVRRRVTMHGFALNVTTDLNAFDAINPCGLGRPVISMATLLGRSVDLAEVGRIYAGRFAETFGLDLLRIGRGVVEETLGKETARAPH
jgi:lipoate-protein ligase B